MLDAREISGVVFTFAGSLAEGVIQQQLRLNFNRKSERRWLNHWAFALFFMPKEKWKPIPGFNGKYFASSMGRIKSMYALSKLAVSRRTGTILKFAVNARGYYIVKLSFRINGKLVGKTYKVHRLIALTYHANPENKPQVNHKDLNQLNNISDNLEWATAKENTNHAQINGRRPVKKTMRAHTGEA